MILEVNISNLKTILNKRLKSTRGLFYSGIQKASNGDRIGKGAENASPDPIKINLSPNHASKIDSDIIMLIF